MNETVLGGFLSHGVDLLYQDDPLLAGLLDREFQRQSEVLTLVAASSVMDPTVLACTATVAGNVTAEGYPGARFHAGCAVIDEIESLAIERAKAAFGATYANVQPHSATTANEIVMFSLLRPGDTLLGLELSSGGHLTHGAPVSVSGRAFHAVGYGLTPQGAIDYEEVRALALEHRPKLIICGTTAFPRTIDFVRFRAIADEVGAWLLADITHVAGLVAAGEHPSSIDHAHVTTTCTHKQLYGPRGGLILLGRDRDLPVPVSAGGGGPERTLAEAMQKGVFPLFQGAPVLNVIAAKARALDRVMSAEFRSLARRIVEDAQALAAEFVAAGYRVVSGGTDNHLVILDALTSAGVTGVVAEKALEACHIVVNKNRIPGDAKSAVVTSGVRIGTNSVALRGMGPEQMAECAALVRRVLAAVRPLTDRDFELDEAVRASVIARVKELCRAFPVPRYPKRKTEAPSAAPEAVPVGQG
ncbi:MAG TPA: serine hydroxymethyltransferase [Thermoanaerobaculia bacterium]|nr:serine hydroxymethyltransferase [Thermoanaerobaculia bacterium]